jgi:arylsulfatase A
MLAETGVMFRTAGCTPLGGPTRAEIMTGRYGFRTGWYANKMRNNTPLYQPHTLFSEVLRDAGYHTAIAGKWQLPGEPPGYAFIEHQLRGNWRILPEGTEYTSGIESHDPSRYNYNYPSRYWHPSIVRNGEYIPTEPDDYGPDMHVDFIIDFIDRHRKGPFMVYYTMNFTHDPFFPTPDNVTSEEDKWISNEGRNFKAMVKYMDHCVGRIVDALDSMNLRENTVVIFTTDNGTGGVDKNHATEGGCRVPLVVNCPGTVQPLGPRDELIDFTDILPTMTELAGTTVPEYYVHDGRSFAPLLLGEPYEERDWIFSYLDYRRMLRDSRWLLEGCEGFIECGGRWLLEGDARFYDCGESREGRGYRDVTHSDDPEVAAALNRFHEILEDLPAPKK